MDKKEIILGVDIGKSGALVGIDMDKNIVFKRKIPIIKEGTKRAYDVNGITHFLMAMQPRFAMIEKPQLVPNTGKKAIADMFYAFGMFEGMFSSMFIAYDYCTPREWQKVAFEHKPKDTKMESVRQAKRLYPQEIWTATERSRIPDNNLTDALHIALYCHRKHWSQNVLQ